MKDCKECDFNRTYEFVGIYMNDYCLKPEAMRLEMGKLIISPSAQIRAVCNGKWHKNMKEDSKEVRDKIEEFYQKRGQVGENEGDNK
jgi:hypothetical protein